MGINDAAEQLTVAQAECVRLERELDKHLKTVPDMAALVDYLTDLNFAGHYPQVAIIPLFGRGSHPVEFAICTDPDGEWFVLRDAADEDNPDRWIRWKLADLTHRGPFLVFHEEIEL